MWPKKSHKNDTAWELVPQSSRTTARMSSIFAQKEQRGGMCLDLCGQNQARGKQGQLGCLSHSSGMFQEKRWRDLRHQRVVPNAFSLEGICDSWCSRQGVAGPRMAAVRALSNGPCYPHWLKSEVQIKLLHSEAALGTELRFWQKIRLIMMTTIQMVLCVRQLDRTQWNQ